MNKTLYIAGPMTGHPEFNYPAFRAAESALRLRGFDVLNPVDVDAQKPVGVTVDWDWYMRRTIPMMMGADAIALLPGWQQSRGATIEHDLASSLRMPIRMVHFWLEDDTEPIRRES